MLISKADSGLRESRVPAFPSDIMLVGLEVLVVAVLVVLILKKEVTEGVSLKRLTINIRLIHDE